MRQNDSSRATGWLGLALAGGLIASASQANAQTGSLAAIPAPAEPTAVPATLVYDPWEGVNRKSFALSMGVDKVVLRPVTKTYKAVTPRPVRQGVFNAVNNLSEPRIFINDVAQGRVKRAARTTSRFVVNSTLGLLGVFDVATRMGIKDHDSDFGQTLGRYGADQGPYIFVPLLGPFVLRDGVGRIVDTITDPVSIIGGGIDTTFGATRTGATVINARIEAEPAFNAMEDSLDPYVAARSAYVQYRASMVRAATREVEQLPDFDDPAAQ